MDIVYLVFVLGSFLGIIVVLLAKVAEIRTGKLGFLHHFSVGADPVFRQVVQRAQLVLSHCNVTNFKKIFHTTAYSVFHIFGTAGLFVSKHYKRLINRVNGQKKLNGGGVVSFFLKHVKEARKEESKDNF